MNKDRPFRWKSHWNQLGWAHKIGGAGPQGITRVGKQWQAGLWRLRYGTCLLAVLGEASEMKQWPLPLLLSGKKLPLQLLSWRLIIEFLPLCPWYLSNCCPRSRTQRKRVSVSPGMGPLRGTLETPTAFVLPIAFVSPREVSISLSVKTHPESSLVFTVRNYGNFSSGTGTLG